MSVSMDDRDIVMRVIAPRNPILARRIMALLWGYERGALRDRVFREPLIPRRAERAASGSPAEQHHDPSDRPDSDPEKLG